MRHTVSQSLEESMRRSVLRETPSEIEQADSVIPHSQLHCLPQASPSQDRADRHDVWYLTRRGSI